MNRQQSLNAIISRSGPWDLAVIGGGATGMGIAVDAASRGYSICLLEQSDFGKGTSSRSTKLIHGGVRYLQRGNISLVREALEERGILRRNAPHLVHDLPFVVPNYSWWESPFYGIGLKLYDVLAGRYGFGKSQLLSKDQVLARIPTLDQTALRGGVLYFDGQFDDSRLLIDLAHTASRHGAALLNYAPVTELTRDSDGFVNGLTFTNSETKRAHTIAARCVINATGPFCDFLRKLDNPAAPPLVSPSQGVHVVLDRSFLPGDCAIMVPRTSDGRVMFAIPWHDRTLIGTTDTPIDHVSLEPAPLDHEIDFLLRTAGDYLQKAPTREDILSVFAGIRPLVKGSAAHTAKLSREHTIEVSASRLLTITGGKWTTYRRMAEDCVDQAAKIAHLDAQPCITQTLAIGFREDEGSEGDDLADYGPAAIHIRQLASIQPELAQPLHERSSITAAQVVWAARHEMARTVEDVLSRRTRALILDARLAMEMAAKVARLLRQELARDEQWETAQVRDFCALAQGYLPP